MEKKEAAAAAAVAADEQEAVVIDVVKLMRFRSKAFFIYKGLLVPLGSRWSLNTTKMPMRLLKSWAVTKIQCLFLFDICESHCLLINM